MVTAVTQLSSSSVEAVFSFNDGSESQSDLQSRRDEIQKELLALASLHEDVQKRICALRKTLAALVEVCGPQVLDCQAPPQACLSEVSHKYSNNTDLCRMVLQKSRGWLALHEIEAAIRRESPAAIARFVNPGVALSNALRTLQRQSKVELRRAGKGTFWKWCGPAANLRDYKPAPFEQPELDAPQMEVNSTLFNLEVLQSIFD